MSGDPSFSFKFMCERGELEIKAALLAASLERFLVGEYELVAGIPEDQDRAPRSETTSLLSRLGVRLATVRNPIGEHYGIGNKIACTGLPTSADLTVFLDSDILCLRRLELPGEIKGPISAKPADLVTFGAEAGAWETVFGHFRRPAPTSRVLTTCDRQLIPPYFNAGVICLEEFADFSRRWAEVCRVLDRDESIRGFHLDQVGLAVVTVERNLDFRCLGEEYNFPAHLKVLPDDRLPILCHYHWPEVIRREPRMNALVADLAEEHPELRILVGASEAWRLLLEPYRACG